MKELERVLEDIDLSEPERAVYLSLLQDGEATARMLALRTGITRTSVYDQLAELGQRGLVVERAEAGTTQFAPADPRRLKELLNDRLEALKQSSEVLNENFLQLLNQSETSEPKIQFYAGQSGVQQMLKDMLWYDNITIEIFWPYSSMVEILGEEFLQWFNERRLVRKIAIKTIWPASSKRLKQHIFKDQDELVERRYARACQGVNMGYIIYEQKVAFISSSKESFGFTVNSQDFSNLMRSQFRSVWQTSR